LPHTKKRRPSETRRLKRKNSRERKQKRYVLLTESSQTKTNLGHRLRNYFHKIYSCLQKAAVFIWAQEVLYRVIKRVDVMRFVVSVEKASLKLERLFYFIRFMSTKVFKKEKA